MQVNQVKIWTSSGQSGKAGWLGELIATYDDPISHGAASPADSETLANSEDGVSFSDPTPANASEESGMTNVMSLPKMFVAKNVGAKSVNTLQEWQGYVDRISDDHFEATLADLTIPTNGAEIARIPLKIVPDEELPFLKMGAVFNLIVGMSRSGKGERQKDTIVYFRKFAGVDENQGEIAASLLRNAIFD
jgi:hypothetical protein